jgi:hypothetical protein
MGLDLRTLLVRQPKLIPIHPRLLSEAANYKRPTMRTILWVRALSRSVIVLMQSYCREKAFFSAQCCPCAIDRFPA